MPGTLGGMGGGKPPYTRAHDDRKPVDVRAVEALLSERLANKMSRNYARADQIRDTLKQLHNVEVHDTERIWHVSRGRDRSPPRGGRSSRSLSRSRSRSPKRERPPTGFSS